MLRTPGTAPQAVLVLHSHLDLVDLAMNLVRVSAGEEMRLDLAGDIDPLVDDPKEGLGRSEQHQAASRFHGGRSA